MKKLLVFLTSMNIICNPVMNFTISCGTLTYYNLPNFSDIKPGDTGKIIEAKVWMTIQSRGLNIEYSDYKLLIEREGKVTTLTEESIIWYQDILIVEILDRDKTPYNDKRVLIDDLRYSLEKSSFNFKINQTKEDIKTTAQMEMLNINNNIQYLNDYEIYLENQNIEELEDFTVTAGQKIKIVSMINSNYITGTKTVTIIENRIDIARLNTELEMSNTYNQICHNLEETFGNNWNQHLDIKIQRDDLKVEFNQNYIAYDDDLFIITALPESNTYFGKNETTIISKTFDTEIKEFLNIEAGFGVEETKVIIKDQINAYFKTVGLIGDRYLVELSDFELEIHGLNISSEQDGKEYLGFNSNIYIRFNEDFKYLDTISEIKPKGIELNSSWFSLEELTVGDNYASLVKIIEKQLKTKASFLNMNDIVIYINSNQLDENYVAALNDEFIILVNEKSKILNGGIFEWQLT